MSFVGVEYKLELQEKFDEFLNVLPIPEDLKQTILDFKPTVKLEKDDETYTLTTSRPDSEDSVTVFKSGEEFEEKIMEHDVKTTITMEDAEDGEKMTQVQTFENGVTFTIERQFTDDDIVVVLKNSLWDGEARRYYRAI